jgi:hypothetical protein
MSDTGETINSDFSMKVGKREVEAHLASKRIRKAIERGEQPAPEDVRKAQGQPIDPGDVYIAPEITDISVGYMMDQNTVANFMCPSVKVAKQKGSYPVFSKSFFFRDEMEERGDAQAAAEGTMGLQFQNYSCPVYAWRLPLGAQARANATPLELDTAGAELCGNKALLKREVLWFNKFFTSSAAWTTKLQLKNSGGGGAAGVDLSFKDSNALPIKQIKAQLDVQAGLTGGLYRCNRAVWSRDVWTAFCEHPNVLSRINAGQTPGGPAEATVKMVAGWLGLDDMIIADAIQTTSAKGVAESSATYSRIATSGQILFAYVPKAPSKFRPSAMYQFDWVPDGSLVGGYGTAVASYYLQERKAQIYEVEMSTDPEIVSPDCGVLLYNCLA